MTPSKPSPDPATGVSPDTSPATSADASTGRSSTAQQRAAGESVPGVPSVSVAQPTRRILRADDPGIGAERDLADVSAVELVSTVAVHLLSAAALRCGLAEDGEDLQDLDEARTIITALAGLVTAAAPDLGDTHARALRAGLRSVQLAFREASIVPDALGDGPGEKFTGPVT